MSAVVIAAGSELLLAGRPDGNGAWLGVRLAGLGIETVWRASVQDDPRCIAALVTAALADADVVVVTGGLGPTEDDRTREGIAAALGVSLVRDDAVVARIEERFRRRGRSPLPAQARQADRPEGAEWIDNPIGTAPGILFERDGRLLAALPGVPAEMTAMFEAYVVPRAARYGGAGPFRRTVRVAGRPESYVEHRVSDLYATAGTVTTILASAGTVDLVVTARGAGPGEARARLDAFEDAVRARLGDDVYGLDDETLAGVVGALLHRRGETIAVAESCTGGLLGAALTDVPGSSAWFRGGLVCYANDLKASLAGVSAAILREYGAVSEPTARALAAGARRSCGADYGLGVTGIAGPGGGTPDKPVGTVHVALDDGGAGRTVSLAWPGDRDLIRRRSVSAALDLVRRRLLEA